MRRRGPSLRIDGRVRCRHAGDARGWVAARACRGLVLLFALAVSPSEPVVAAGLLPERVNQFIVYTRAPGPPPRIPSGLLGPAHRRVPLPGPARFRGMAEGALARYDRRTFVAVPAAR